MEIPQEHFHDVQEDRHGDIPRQLTFYSGRVKSVMVITKEHFHDVQEDRHGDIPRQLTFYSGRESW